MNEKELKAIMDLREAMTRAAKILGDRGTYGDDEAWGAFSQCVAAMTNFDSIVRAASVLPLLDFDGQDPMVSPS